MLVCVHSLIYDGRRINSFQGMFICQLVVGVIVATCSHDWDKHAVAGWVAVVFVWLCKFKIHIEFLIYVLKADLQQILPTSPTELGL